MTDYDSTRNKEAKDRSLVLEDKAVLKDFRDLPARIRNQFLVNLGLVCQGQPPALPHEKLKAAGEGVVEMKINGRPAYRCMYIVRKNGDVVPLHATAKTAQGQDRQLTKTTALRLKRLAPTR